MSVDHDAILLLDPYARAGRTKHRLLVKDARRLRSQARDALGVSRDDVPPTIDIVRAADALTRLLYDATEGDARIMIQTKDGETWRPAEVLAVLR